MALSPHCLIMLTFMAISAILELQIEGGEKMSRFS